MVSNQHSANGCILKQPPEARNETVVATEHGKPVMALMPIENADLETVSLSTDPRFVELIERSRALYKPGAGIPLKDVRRKYGPEPKPRKPARPRSSRP